MARILQLTPLTAGWSAPGRAAKQSTCHTIVNLRRSIMTWSKPEFIDWRFGFEITLYIANR